MTKPGAKRAMSDSEYVRQHWRKGNGIDLGRGVMFEAYHAPTAERIAASLRGAGALFVTITSDTREMPRSERYTARTVYTIWAIVPDGMLV